MMMDYEIGKGETYSIVHGPCRRICKSSMAKQCITNTDYDKVKDIEWLTQMKSGL